MSARVRFCPVKHEALAAPTDARASTCALSAMTWRELLISVENCVPVLRKPLLYPSELRGHGPGTLWDCFEFARYLWHFLGGLALSAASSTTASCVGLASRSVV